MPEYEFSPPQTPRIRFGFIVTIILWLFVVCQPFLYGSMGEPDRGQARNESVNRAMSVLKNKQRREVLAAIMEANRRTMTIDDLADTMVKRGTQDMSREKMKIHLIHIHLPILAEVGLIEFAPRSGLLRYHGDAEVERLCGLFDDWESDL